jgi:tRNA-binding protein
VQEKPFHSQSEVCATSVQEKPFHPQTEVCATSVQEKPFHSQTEVCATSVQEKPFHSQTEVCATYVLLMTFTPAPIKSPVEMSDLEKIDVRVGTILSVEEMTNSDKLMRLRVSFGDHERTIISGIKQEREDPQEIVGKQALFVINLPPRKMRGEISEAMLFDIGYADGLKPVLAVTEKATEDGARAG